MALQPRPRVQKRCQWRAWAWLLLLLTTTALEIIIMETLIPQLSTTVLNALLTGMNAILVFLLWSARVPMEACPFLFSCPLDTDRKGQGDLFCQGRRCKSARAVSPRQKVHKVSQNVVPGFQGTTLTIEAVSRRARGNLPYEQIKVTPTNRRSYTSLLTASADPLLKSPAFVRTKRPSVSTEVLLVSVTDIESQAILAVFPRAIKTVIQNRTYYSLGRVGQTRTYMVQATGMGPVGVRTCIEDGIRALSPEAVILVGIAFGLKTGCQQIGDILVSRQIQDYDPQRHGTGPDQQLLLHLRGNRVTATEWLLDRFSAGKHDWQGPATIHIGLLLSGSLLIDHHEMRERLLYLAPEALGGEMEGATFCDVALRNHVDWIVVKAIADWADGRKRQDEQEHQKYAAENAAQFVLHILRQPDFLQKNA
jgi:nucleoside phosphorylase